MKNIASSTTGVVGQLNVFPLKGGQGHAVDRVTAKTTGLEHDRCFMLVDSQGNFLSQRQLPLLSLIDWQVSEGGFRLSLGQVHQVFRFTADDPRPVSVWGEQVNGHHLGQLSEALTKALGADAEIFFVAMDPKSPRYASRGVVGEPRPYGFADGYPYLLANQASLDALYAESPELQVPMDRFRANIVVTGWPAFMEDRVESFRLGGRLWRLASPCTRCKVTTIDQEKGSQPGYEPLITLRRLRMSKKHKGLLFGWNMILADEGEAELVVGECLQDVQCSSESRVDCQLSCN